MTIMSTGNHPSIRMGIQRFGLRATDTFVELGAAHGAGLQEIARLPTSQIPKRIVCVEISNDLQKLLHKTVQGLPKKLPVEIHTEDCIRMPYLDDNSVDKIFAMNVVYFLDPLSEYLNEIGRVLKSNGEVVFGCKFARLPTGTKEFVNIEQDAIVAAMEKAGLEVTTEKVVVDPDPDKESLNLNYIEIKGKKKM